MMRRRLVLGLVGSAALQPLARAQAQADWSDRPIILVDPSSPGGSTEFFLRPLAELLSKSLARPVLLEHKPGAAGAIAAEHVARARPDGHTIGLAAVSTHVTTPLTNAAVRYDPVKDFAPVTMLVRVPSATFVRADSPLRTLGDLVEAARSKPEAVSFASPGVGSAGHILLEHFARLAGVRFLHVPYRGSSEMYADLMGGRLDVAGDNIPALLPRIRDGSLRAIAVRDVRRVRGLPEVATYAEQGFPAVTQPLWFGLVAPAGTPQALIDRLNRAVHDAIRTPGYAERIDAGAATPAHGTPDEMGAEIVRWLTHFRAVISEAGIKTS